VAAARGDNGIGMAGVAWHCRIMPVKVLDDSGSGFWRWVANGIVYAADHGASVLSMSIAKCSMQRAVSGRICAFATEHFPNCTAISIESLPGVGRSWPMI